jgi:four helix bundle protein
MAQISRFEDLPIWQLAIELAVKIYNISLEGKLKNDFELKAQIKDAAVSVSNNIAEGFEYDNNADFIRFLTYSKGSVGEVRSMINFLQKVEYISNEKFDEIYNDCINLSKQINNFRQYIKNTKSRKR